MPHSPDAVASLARTSTVSLYDQRPFFEKALLFGVQHGIIDGAKLDAIGNEAPKGMVQIARYFGTEFLRPELERAKERIVNLVSLYLENSSDGDLRLAAESLRDHSFLSRSKGGSDLLKALLAMPQNSHFGMNERAGFSDDKIPLLAKWSMASLSDYQAELAKRSQVAQVMDAALWLADELGMQADALEESGPDSEAVIRTALLTMACKRTELPDWVAFERMVAVLRKKYAGIDPPAVPILGPKNLPAHFTDAIEAVRQSVIADLPKILDANVSARKLFSQTPAYSGRYFWVEDGLNEVDDYDRTASAAWQKATGGHDDEGSLITLFLCIAAGSAPKTLLTEKAAVTLIRKIRKTGLSPELANRYIRAHAPVQHQDDYVRLWMSFCDEAQSTLQSDYDYELKDALALLRRECNVK
ncbi:MAG: hypothetical protein KJ614_18545 [Gammaproteobacteria bacterium]|uniref:hypothetical protein n=1 Tax=Rhodoferax sp. TaxID=50421 RepID=UPI0017E4C69B|nr:hypothetical protein [Rhodoferax sp.]MBU3900885.1 hypothetical protein [Gammaproteobacteria bacterium]MBA3058675.1 hypothetical protein [Rhodoferax sp.]MBU3998342.1 hypothetical protein [Gammaproteobacteria bacterium]MBU4082239.1 hypothetical protein [Gammaproteobacteria bacterium]MBU4112789.1 hypothetical protein [Gammaproteobacteria bacterium]